MKKIILLFILVHGFSTFLIADNFTQTIKGRVMDKQAQFPLPGANIVVLNTNPLMGAVSDENGYFKISNIPIGRVSIEVSYLGYNSYYLNNISLTTGKELVLEIELEEKVFTSDEVVITAEQEKGFAVNQMASVSVATFSAEETERFSGSRNDVARMASNFAGVSALNDATNDIVIRGNSPNGLLWQMEGIPIPNPNHFGQLGATGGPVNMLNNNTLANSDFFTGAFPAEYGNAVSGVFDLSMRNGNYDKHEFLGQIGFNGFEFGAEGPISKKNNSSYLAGYRYSTLGVFSALGINFGTGASIPKYQDLSFKVNIPLPKSARIEIYGLGGTNEITFLSSSLDSAEVDENLYSTENLDIYSKGKMGVVGFNYIKHLNPTTYINAGLAVTYINNQSIVDTVFPNKQTTALSRRNYSKTDWLLTLGFNKKWDSKNYLKAGMLVDRIGFNLIDSTFLSKTNSFETLVDADGSTFMISLFAAWQHRFSEKLELNTGIYSQNLTLNKSFSVEPRVGIVWYFKPRQLLSLAYGLHSRSQLPEVYFTRFDVGGGIYEAINENLDFTRSHHAVAGYNIRLSENLNLKIEAYFQYLYDVPVENTPSNFSLINASSVQYFDYDTLQNTGTGRNYGIELTFERFLKQGFYILSTVSLFDSKYKGSDGELRSTAFDSKYVANLLAGKEFKLGNHNSKSKYKTWLSFDTKVTAAGGLRYTPVNIEQSVEKGYTVYDQSQAFAKQFSDYFRLDFKTTIRLDSKKVSQLFSVDIQNITNHTNPLYILYNTTLQEEVFINQLGLFPTIQYRIVF